MNLKNLRIEKGLSQKELAEAAGISVRYLQNYEQGVRDVNGANIKTLIRLSNALDCKVIDLLTDSETIELFNQANFK